VFKKDFRVVLSSCRLQKVQRSASYRFERDSGSSILSDVVLFPLSFASFRTFGIDADRVRRPLAISPKYLVCIRDEIFVALVRHIVKRDIRYI
jgi:hypothetical protein